MIWPERLRSEGADRVHYPPAECQENAVALREYVDRLCSDYRPDLLLVDTFPRGILGELEQLRWSGPRWLVARWMRPEYAEKTEVEQALARYAQVCACEKLPWPNSVPIGPVVGPLGEPASPRQGVLWLGSGPPVVQARLAEFLWEQLGSSLQIAAPDLGQPRAEIDSHLASSELVISAAGYNAYHQIVQSGIPAILWPQQRLYDDQFLRADGQLGVAPRGWVRVVQNFDQLSQALAEWREQKPQAVPGQALAQPDNLLRLLNFYH